MNTITTYLQTLRKNVFFNDSKLLFWKAYLTLIVFVFITINMSMVLGLLPIVGSPLPIMSYGGSSMLATMIGFGIVMSARVHNQQLIA